MQAMGAAEVHEPGVLQGSGCRTGARAPPMFAPVCTEEDPAGAGRRPDPGRMTVADAEDLPDFARSTVDGYAVQAASTFGAS
ncbi:MAG: hypothetical protein MZV70_22020 [Desulfobacterales bacterium]|nr:hypothetical protein [Desulfobacterales bacterium]